ncbi:MAG TPA: DUF4352 domain-containing protein [Candidatus Ligilactobacillus excrementipullorum]|nr:DUF4352 domain-containing protein [Candidatus Ligilactobacillus excrementipullorum]
MHHKKLFAFLLTTLSVFLLVGCGGQKKAKENPAAPKNGTAVKVLKGEYIIPDNKDEPSSGKGYLALKLRLKNNGSPVRLSSISNFKLKSKSDDELNPVSIYGTGDEFSTISSMELDEDDDATGYVLFLVDKKSKYTLEVKPTSKKAKEVPKSKVKIDASKYKDNTSQAKDAVSAYVDSVFLNQSDKDDQYEKLLTNELLTEKNSYRRTMRSYLENTVFHSPIVDKAANKMMDQFQTANAEQASVSYQIKEATPTAATVEVTPTVMDLSNVSNVISQTSSNLLKSDKLPEGTTYTQVQRAAKEMVVAKFADVLKQIPARERTSAEIRLVKNGKKWRISTSDYGFKSVRDKFMGQAY